MISVVTNVILEMSDDALCGLNNLAVLILRQCKLREMPPVDPVKNTLHTLMLFENEITNISKDYFEGFTVLMKVSLSYNRLTAIPDVSPVRDTLLILRVSSNYITSIPSSVLDNIYPRVTEIRLKGNKIKAFPPSAFSSWPNIRKFDIRNNKLSKLYEHVFLGVNHSSYVDIFLYGNPWRCDSAFSWFIGLSTGKYTDETGATVPYGILGRVRFPFYKLIQCAEPRAHVGKMVADLGTFKAHLHYMGDLGPSIRVRARTQSKQVH